MHFTGIGARKTPSEVLTMMEEISSWLCSDKKFILRSGGANGADTAFETGCDLVDGEKEIYLPWKNFNQNTSSLYNISPTAFEISKEVYGPRWSEINSGVRKLMARNVYQILGHKLINIEKSKFVICYTEDGCESAKSRSSRTGGTGQAIMLADYLDIPIINLRNNNALKRINNEIEIINLFDG